MTDKDDSDTGGMNLDLGSLLNKARQVKEQMEQAQETAAQVRVEGSAGAGMVKATANGNGQVLRISIEQQLFESGDKAMIEDLTVAAVNQAVAKGKTAMQEEMTKVTGGMQLPFDISKLF
jgi:DNA-binding YbaB/EbfC family protein